MSEGWWVDKLTFIVLISSTLYHQVTPELSEFGFQNTSNLI